MWGIDTVISRNGMNNISCSPVSLCVCVFLSVIDFHSTCVCVCVCVRMGGWVAAYVESLCVSVCASLLIVMPTIFQALGTKTT